MANEYASLADLKLAVQVEPTDTTRDSLLNRALSAAARSIDRTCGRRFWLDPDPVQRTYTPAGRIVRDAEAGDVLLVDDIGSTTGLIVEVGSGSTWTTVTDYEATPDNALADGLPITGLRRPLGHWTARISTTRVRVTARGGWPAVPDDIAQANLIQAARLYRRKDSPEGVTGSAEWGAVRLSRRDHDVYGLIEHFILPGFG